MFHIYIYLLIHVLTGADATSGFFGKEKKSVMKNAFKCINETKERLENFVKTLVLSEKVINDLIMLRRAKHLLNHVLPCGRK